LRFEGDISSVVICNTDVQDLRLDAAGHVHCYIVPGSIDANPVTTDLKVESYSLISVFKGMLKMNILRMVSPSFDGQVVKMPKSWGAESKTVKGPSALFSMTNRE
jgi:hypothetical protein